MIHLNASDERGIDIIRNQINQFCQFKHIYLIKEQNLLFWMK